MIFLSLIPFYSVTYTVVCLIFFLFVSIYRLRFLFHPFKDPILQYLSIKHKANYMQDISSRKDMYRQDIILAIKHSSEFYRIWNSTRYITGTNTPRDQPIDCFFNSLLQENDPNE